MDYIPFGRSGINVSAAGLGCGGYSRLGQANGISTENSAEIIQKAIDLGVTFIDTSPSYENESLVGKAIAGSRDKIVLSTKFSTLNREGARIDGPAVRYSLEKSLERLDTDYVDVFSIQSVTEAKYEYCVHEILPTLVSLKQEGLIRSFGLTEWFYDDTAHKMATRAVNDGYWDYLLVGFNMLNQSAKKVVLPSAAASGVATAIMFAVRRVLSNKENLRRLVSSLIDSGQLEPTGINRDDPLDFLLTDGSCSSLTEAAYRFCRHESEGGIILTGTGNLNHLEDNIRAISLGPLPTEHSKRLYALFDGLDTLTGQEIVDEAGAIVKKHVAGKPKGH